MDESTSTLMPETTRIWLDAETSRHWYKNFTVASMLSSHNDGADQQRQMEPSLFTDNNAYWSALFVGGQGPNNQSPTQFNASEWKELCDNLPALETSEEDVKKHMGELITNINSNSYPAIKRFLDRELREEQRDCLHKLASRFLGLDSAMSKQLVHDLMMLDTLELTTLYTPIRQHLCGMEVTDQESAANVLRTALKSVSSPLSNYAATSHEKLTPANMRKNEDIVRVSEPPFLRSEYVDDFPGMLQHFCARMHRVAMEFATDDAAGSTRLIAPYIAVVQSPGSGKSRLLFEFAKRHLSFFICTRNEESIGYPLRSPLAARHLLPGADVLGGVFRHSEFLYATLTEQYMTFYVSFFAACLYYVADELPTLVKARDIARANEANVPLPPIPECQNWIELQLASTHETQAIFWSSVINIHRSVMAVCIGSTNTKYDPMDSISEVASHVPINRAACMLRHAANELKACIDTINRDGKTPIPTTVAFIFDEARTLLKTVGDTTDEKQTFLRYMQLAMNFIPKATTNCVSVAVALVDTFGYVPVYTPPTIPDPSLRFIPARRVFQPFILFPRQVPPRWASGPPLKRDDIIRTWRETGRRLWRSYSTSLDLLEVAMQKLQVGDTVEADSHTDKKRLLHLAVIGVRMGFTYNAQSKLLLPLVHNHGAMLYSVSDDRTVTSVGYPSEPLLAAAAAQLTFSSAVKWVDLLETLVFEARTTGLVHTGERDELSACVLLLMAFDFVRLRVSKNTDPLFADFNVRMLLNTLFYGNEQPDVESCIESCIDALIGKQWSTSNKKSFLDGIVNFTHFVYTTHSPRHDEMQRFFCSFAAIVCRFEGIVYDLIVPVYLKDSASYTYIVVQVKMHRAGTGLPSLPDDVELEGGLRTSANHQLSQPFLYVFLQLGHRSKPWKSQLHLKNGGRLRKVTSSTPFPTTHRMATIGACGLATSTFPFLTEPECHWLERLSTAWVDPVDLVRNSPWASRDSDDTAGGQIAAFSADVLQSMLHLNYPSDDDDDDNDTSTTTEAASDSSSAPSHKA